MVLHNYVRAISGLIGLLFICWITAEVLWRAGKVKRYRVAVYHLREGVWRMSTVIDPQLFWFKSFAKRTAEAWKLELRDANYDMRAWQVHVHEDPCPSVLTAAASIS